MYLLLASLCFTASKFTDLKMGVERKQSKNPRQLGLTDKEDRFYTSSLQCIDAVNIQQLPQKLYLNEIIYNPAMF